MEFCLSDQSPLLCIHLCRVPGLTVCTQSTMQSATLKSTQCVTVRRKKPWTHAVFLQDGVRPGSLANVLPIHLSSSHNSHLLSVL